MTIIEFGNLLRLMRISKGMSLVEVSRETGVDKTLLGHLEIGLRRSFPHDKTLTMLAGFFGFRYQYIPEQLLLIRPPEPLDAAMCHNEVLTLEESEKQCIFKALKVSSGNRAKAAKLLGAAERTLYRKLEKYDLLNIEI